MDRTPSEDMSRNVMSNTLVGPVPSARAMVLALGDRDMAAVSSLVEAGYEINRDLGNGMTALMIAAQTAHVEVLEVLLKAHAETNACDHEGKTALHWAFLRELPGSTLEVITRLVDRGANVNVQCSAGFTPLSLAADGGDRPTVEYLLSKGATVDLPTEKGTTALHFAVSNGHSDIARLLILSGANVNAIRNEGDPALIEAAKSGYEECVKVLLAGGTDVMVRGGTNDTSLHWAAAKGHVGIATLLLDYGAEVNARDNVQMTPLLVSAAASMVAVAEVLLKRGADADARQYQGVTPLNFAIKNSNVEIVEMLLVHGADSDNMLPTPSGMLTPIEWALACEKMSSARGEYDSTKRLRMIGDILRNAGANGPWQTH